MTTSIYKYMDKSHKIHFNNFLETFLTDFGLLTRQHHTVILSAEHT